MILPLARRIEASKKIIEAGYPMGFIIASVFLDGGWQEKFGYGKYVYPKEKLKDMKEFFQIEISKYFIEANIKYII